MNEKPVFSSSSHEAAEAQIAHLAGEIERLRQQIDAEHGIVREDAPPVSDRDLVHRAIASDLGRSEAGTAARAVSSSGGDPAVEEAVGRYVSRVLEGGIRSVRGDLAAETPFVADRVHDTLADHYYEELRKRNLTA